MWKRASGMQCLQFHQQKFDVQWTTGLFGMMCISWEKPFPTHSLNLVTRKLMLTAIYWNKTHGPQFMQIGEAGSGALPAAMQNGLCNDQTWDCTSPCKYSKTHLRCPRLRKFPRLRSQNKKAPKFSHLINITCCPFNIAPHKVIPCLKSNKYDDKTIFLPI
jgi:hypothetical protein